MVRNDARSDDFRALARPELEAAVVDDANRLYEQRRLHVSQTFAGMGRIDGDADPESTETILTALEAADGAATDPTTPVPRRSGASTPW